MSTSQGPADAVVKNIPSSAVDFNQGKQQARDLVSDVAELPPARSPPSVPVEDDEQSTSLQARAGACSKHNETSSSQAAKPSRLDHAKVFATRNAPFIKHLEKWTVWREAQALHHYFCSCVDTVSSAAWSCTGSEEVARIIDITIDAGKPQYHQRATVHLANLMNTELYSTEKADRLNGFFDSVANRTSKVHTRIIVMENYTHGDGTGHHQVAVALSKLLYAHLLGAVLKLYPAHVALLIGGVPIDTFGLLDTSQTRRQPLEHGQASFGIRDTSDAGCIVHWIDGLTQDGQRQDTVIISACHTWPATLGGNRWPSSSYGISRPPRVQAKLRDRTPLNMDGLGYEIPRPAARLLLPAIMQAVEEDRDADANTKSSHWLAAVLQVEYSYLCYEFDQAEDLHSALENDLKTRQRGRHETRLRQTNSYKKMSEAIQACLEETTAICADIRLCPEEQHHHSLQRILTQINRLQRLVQRRLTAVEFAAKQEFESRQVQMTQLSINESRNAIALTFLAFIFVPMSLATSVFGMNVQEINGTGSSAWIPVLLAICLMVLSLAALRTWRAWERWLKNFELTNDIKEEEKWRAVRQEVKLMATQRQEDIVDTVKNVPKSCRTVLGAVGHQTRKITRRIVGEH